MSDGRTHARIAWIVEVGIVATSVTLDAMNIVKIPMEASIGLAAGGAVGILITPDIDHDQITFEELRWYRLGRLFGLAWQIWWAGYPIIFRHRGWSHTPIIGTTTRIIYIALQLLVVHSIIYTLTGYDLVREVRAYLESIPTNTLYAYAIPIFAAWSFVDTIHFITDVLSTKFKRSSFNHI